MGAAPSKSKDLSLRNILIFVLYSGVLIIMFVLLAKRQIKRMRLRYDTNFETRQVMGFPKHYSNEVQMRLDKAIQPRHHPFLIEKDDYKSVADRSILQMDNESTLRMKALYIVDNTFQIEFEKIDKICADEKNENPDFLKIKPQEDILEWYKRITAPTGKYSTLSITSFEQLVLTVRRNYIHARHEPEKFGVKNFDEIYEACGKLTDRLKNEAKKKRGKKQKKLKKTEQAIQLVRHAGEAAAQFNPFSKKSEEHQKLL